MVDGTLSLILLDLQKQIDALKERVVELEKRPAQVHTYPIYSPSKEEWVFTCRDNTATSPNFSIKQYEVTYNEKS
jgi:hypothetical protein